MKRCYACKQHKPYSEFYRSNKCYWQKECKTCNRERKGRWHQTESGKRSSANTKLKRRFGISIEEYEAWLNSVDGQCEICGARESVNGHRLAIDHDHATGDLRGILCKSCNMGIAKFKDSATLLSAAIAYLASRPRLMLVGNGK